MSNPALHTILSKVSAWKGRNGRFLSIITEFGKKLQFTNAAWSGITERMNTLQRMMRAYATRQYTMMPWKSMVIAVAGVIYFLDPFDLIPDFIPVGGFVDDITVLMWVFSSLKGELDRFLEWEKAHLLEA